MHYIRKNDTIITLVSHKKGENLKKVLKRLKSQRGISGVLVALLLVVVGVGLVAGVSTFLSNNKDKIQVQAQKSLIKAGVTDAVAK